MSKPTKSVRVLKKRLTAGKNTSENIPFVDRPGVTQQIAFTVILHEPERSDPTFDLDLGLEVNHGSGWFEVMRAHCFAGFIGRSGQILNPRVSITTPLNKPITIRGFIQTPKPITVTATVEVF